MWIVDGRGVLWGKLNSNAVRSHVSEGLLATDSESCLHCPWIYTDLEGMLVSLHK